MHCEICGADPEALALLPRRQSDGRLETLACIPCSIATGMYCQAHERPHLGFEDGTTACVPCIEEVLERDGERIAGSLSIAITQLEKGSEIREGLRRWIAKVDEATAHVTLGDLPFAIRYRITPHALNITRAVVSLSKRRNISPEEVIRKVTQEGVGVIVPSDLTE